MTETGLKKSFKNKQTNILVLEIWSEMAPHTRWHFSVK